MHRTRRPLGWFLLLVCPVVILVVPERTHAEERVQRVAVVDATGSGVETSVLDSLTDAVGAAVAETPGFAALTGQDVQELLSLEAQRRLVGGDASDFGTMAQLLDVDRILRTAFTRVGDRWLLTGSLLDPHRAEVVNRASERVEGDAAQVAARLPAFVRTLLSVPARLELAGQVDGARVFVDDILVATLPATQIPLARSGAATLRADHLPFSTEITLTAGRTTRVALEMPSYRELEAASARRRGFALGATLGGLALAGLGGAAAAEGWNLYRRYDALDPRRSTQAELDGLASQSRTYLGLGYGGLAAGAALLAAGVYLFLVDPHAAHLEAAGAGGGLSIAC